MLSTNHEKIKEIFFAALDLETEHRETFLAKTCSNVGVRREVESLLQAQKDAGNFLDDFSVAGVIQNSYQNKSNEKFIGQLIDKYRIIKEIGRGGMGIVFLAMRETFHQQVAVKIIKRGMDSDAILERFFRERQILASLNHPYIANLLDGGTTADGLPYFVMEYVDGVAIDEFCKNLKEKEILKLFIKACSAISFAHQKLIVHRDLKPSNILINANGEPKLLDFGIAKLLDETESNETHPHQRVLTPAYASPEQVSGSIVGTASDVYSLGKIIAELLNRPPDDDKDNSILSPDLQNIIAMAVRDDAELRYGSVERFSDDLGRYIQDLPVSARKISFPYRAKKFVQRNKVKTALASLLALSLAGGLTATILKANEATRERTLAEKRFQNLRKLSDSFVTELHGAIQNLPGSLPARQLLLKRATEQLDTLAEESGNNRLLQDDLADAYFNLASLPDMQVNEKDLILKKDIQIYKNLLLSDPNNAHYLEQLAFAYIELGDTAKVRGSVADGLELSKMAVSIFERLATEQTGDVSRLRHLRNGYGNLAAFYISDGNAQQSLAAARRALEISMDLRDRGDSSGDVSQLISRSHLQIGTALTDTGDYTTAVGELQTALDGYTLAGAENPNDTSVNYYLWSANRRLAAAVELGGDKKLALEYARKAVSVMENLLATSPKDIGYHRNSAITHILTGQMLVRQNQVSEAVKHFRRALDLSNQVMENDPEYFESKIDLARAKSSLGNALIITGRKEQGLSLLRDSLKIYDETVQIDTGNALLKRNYAEACSLLGDALRQREKPQAIELYRISLKLWSELKSKGMLNAANASRIEDTANIIAGLS